MHLAFKKYGHGSQKVLVLHDWFSDHTSYEPLQPYLNTEDFQYAFVDLRGYGTSLKMTGVCSLEEAAEDLINLVDHLQWSTFHVISHSMSALITQHLNFRLQKRLRSVVAITPVPAWGSPVEEEMEGFLIEAASHNDESAEQIIRFMTSNRLPSSFYQDKVKKWRQCSAAEARISYFHMFTKTNISSQVQGLPTPYLVVLGEHDGAAYQADALEKGFRDLLKNVEFKTCASGHYPMQETPPHLAGLIETFFQKHPIGDA